MVPELIIQVVIEKNARTVRRVGWIIKKIKKLTRVNPLVGMTFSDAETFEIFFLLILFSNSWNRPGQVVRVYAQIMLRIRNYYIGEGSQAFAKIKLLLGS